MLCQQFLNPQGGGQLGAPILAICPLGPPKGPPEKYSRPYRLQQVAEHNQSEAEVDLIGDISGLRRHLPEGFTRCRPIAYPPSIIIELAEFFYRQPAPVDLADSARVAKNQRQILYLSGPSALSCNLINIMRTGSPSYPLAMALEEAFKICPSQGKFSHPLHFSESSEWRQINMSSMLLRVKTQGRSYQATIHSPAWMHPVFRLRGQDSVSGKVSNTLHQKNTLVTQLTNYFSSFGK